MSAESEFIHHMNAMKEHHKAGVNVMYALPNDLMAGADLSGAEEPVSAETKAAVAGVKTGLTQFTDGQKTGVADAKAKLKADQDKGVDPDAATKSFKEQMEALKKKAKADAAKKIDTMYDGLIAVGTKHPKQQKHILTATQLIGVFFTKLLASIVAWFKKIGKAIVEWFKSVGAWFEQAGKDIADWFEGAGKSIGNFFGGLFG